MKITSEEIEQILELLENSELLTESEQELVRKNLLGKKDFDDEYLVALSTWIEAEDRYNEEVIREMESSLKNEEGRAKKRHEKVLDDSERIRADLQRMFQKELESTVVKLKAIEKETLENQEKIIKSAEGGEEEAIRKFLKKERK